MGDQDNDRDAAGPDQGDDVVDLGHGEGARAGDLGPGLGARDGTGLTAHERRVVDRVARDERVREGRVQLGRYAATHPGALRERTGGGLSDADAADAVVDAAQRFGFEDDRPADLERAKLVNAVLEAQHDAAYRKRPDPNVATFLASIPNGGIKTNRNNDWVITLEVAWDNRSEAMRLVETAPMQLLVTFERVDDA